VHLVHCVRISHEVGRVLGDALGRCLLDGVKALGRLPLDAESLPPEIELRHRLGGLGGHTAFAKNHAILLFDPFESGLTVYPLKIVVEK
jgi:hypothetical protein